MSFFSSTIGGLMSWLTLHQGLAYLVLFTGSYTETLIGASFFIPGEVFFLAGSILAGAHVLNIWLVALVIYPGAILGDTSSYWIGRYLGKRVFKEGRWVFSMVNYQKGEEFFKRHGNKSIFLARLLGPLSWITPFLAGAYAIPYPEFLKYNIPGILVGIGEFLIVGYFFGNQYQRILGLVQQYLLAVGVVALLLFIGIRYLISVEYFKNWREKRSQRL